eukprot:m51a1_g10142 hypothetical protein (1177) ;mRNA; r:55655-62138
MAEAEGPPALQMNVAGSAPLGPASLAVSVDIVGFLWETTLLMTFRNPTSADLDGELVLPLEHGTPQPCARVCYEAEARERPQQRGPAVAERLAASNAFRARVRPLPARGSRTVRVCVAGELGAGGRYALPLRCPASVESLSVAVCVRGPRGSFVPPALPRELQAALGVAEFSCDGLAAGCASYSLRATALHAVPPPVLSLCCAQRPGDVVLLEPPCGPDEPAFFCLCAEPPLPRPLRAGEFGGMHAAVVWDASKSRQRCDRNAAVGLIEEVERAAQGIAGFDLYVLRVGGIELLLRQASAGAVGNAVRDVRHNGATDLSSVGRVVDEQGPNCSFVLLFSDGVDNWGDPDAQVPVWSPGKPRVHTLSCDQTANYPLLRRVAAATTGLYCDLRSTSPADAARAMLGGCVPLLKVEHNPGQVSDILPTTPYQPAGMVESLEQLPQTEDTRKEILSLGRKYGLVTSNSSLIVLETLEQYLRYDIEPPRCLAEISREYALRIGERRKQLESEDERHGAIVRAAWKRRAMMCQVDDSLPDTPASQCSAQRMPLVRHFINVLDLERDAYDPWGSPDVAELPEATPHIQSPAAVCVAPVFQSETADDSPGQPLATVVSKLDGIDVSEWSCRKFCEVFASRGYPEESVVAALRETGALYSGVNTIQLMARVILHLGTEFGLDKALEEVRPPPPAKPLSLLFGKRKPATDSVSALREVVRSIEKRTATLERRCVSLEAEAKEKVRKGNRTAALSALKRKRIVEEQMGKLQAVHDQYSENAALIESSGTNLEAMKAMPHTCLESIEDSSGIANEISDSLAAAPGFPESEEDSLQAQETAGDDVPSREYEGDRLSAAGWLGECDEPAQIPEETQVAAPEDLRLTSTEIGELLFKLQRVVVRRVSTTAFLECAALAPKSFVTPCCPTRCVSNVVEGSLENAERLRIAAALCEEAELMEPCRWALERVLRMRPEEPQSHRDLALAVARLQTPSAAAAAQRALALLGEVAERRWDRRFHQVEVVALMDAAALCAHLPGSCAPLPRGLGPELAAEQPARAELRVVLTWSADACDVDLQVVEPSGERCTPFSNRTASGAFLSRDLTEGYGPVEYVAPRAARGEYAIYARLVGRLPCGSQGVLATVHIYIDEHREMGQHCHSVLLRTPDSPALVGRLSICSVDPDDLHDSRWSE